MHTCHVKACLHAPNRIVALPRQQHHCLRACMTKMRSKRDSMALLSLRFSCTVFARLYCPPAGFAAASTEARAGSVAQMPAFATLSSPCSIAPSSAWSAPYLILFRAPSSWSSSSYSAESYKPNNSHGLATLSPVRIDQNLIRPFWL